MIDDQHILEYFLRKSDNNIDSNKLRNVPEEIKEYLMNRYPEDEFVSFSGVIKRIKYHVDECPKCHNCGKKLINIRYKNGQVVFPKYCGPKCQMNCEEGLDTYKNGVLKKYGVDNVAKSPIVYSKMRQTCLERYGVDSILKRPEVIEKSKVNSHTPEAISKAKQTNIERYGVECAMHNPEIQEKIRLDCVYKYGSRYWGSSDIGRKTLSYINSSEETKDKIRKTCLEKYGSDSWASSYVGRKTLSYILSSQESKDKKAKTCLERYGTNHWAQSDVGRKYLSYMLNSIEVRDKIRATCLERYHVDSFSKTEEFNVKCYTTKKLNNTFRKSKPEDYVGELLIKKFKNVKPQYNECRYPFACDFYIPSIDLFIEYQGNWTHGFHVFDPTNKDDLKTLELWKSKSEEGHGYYANAIKTWTIADPKKREYAKKNNLNYLEFFNMDQFLDWYSTF